MYEKILSEWENELAKVKTSLWYKRLEAGKIQICNYKGYLQESYHHAGLNPQIQAFATMYFHDNPREIIGMFLQHARSEIGHDLLVLSDLELLGVERSEVMNSRPLPSTVAFNAFVLFQIQFHSPLCYLGYLFHLEHMATKEGNV